MELEGEKYIKRYIKYIKDEKHISKLLRKNPNKGVY